MVGLAADWLQPLFAAMMDMALALALGVAVLRPVVNSINAITSARLASLNRWACGLLGIALLAYWCSSTVAMTADALTNLPAACWLVLTQSHFGTMLWLAGAAWLLLTLGTLKGLAGGAPLCMLGLIAFALARAGTGHAADQGFFSVAVLTHTAHILTATTWIGSVMGCAFLSTDWEHWELAERSALAHRLSEVATWALLLVLATGLFNVARTLGHASDIWVADYTRILLAKLCGVLIAACLGLRNRWFWLTKLDHDQATSAAGFRRVLIAELGLLLVVLVLAAKLGTTMPAQ